MESISESKISLVRRKEILQIRMIALRGVFIHFDLGKLLNTALCKKCDYLKKNTEGNLGLCQQDMPKGSVFARLDHALLILI